MSIEKAANYLKENLSPKPFAPPERIWLWQNDAFSRCADRRIDPTDIEYIRADGAWSKAARECAKDLRALLHNLPIHLVSIRDPRSTFLNELRERTAPKNLAAFDKENEHA